MSNLVLLVLLVGLHVYWLYKLTTYDWSRFDEDSQNDDFLKPLGDANHAVD